MGTILRTLVLTGFFGLALFCTSRVNAKETDSDKSSYKMIFGSSNVISEPRNVSNFNKVTLRGASELHITQGKEEALKIEAEDNILPLLDSTVAGGILNLEPKHASFQPSKPIKYFLTVKNLEGIQSYGANIISNEGALTANDFNLEIRGAGNTRLSNLALNSFTAVISGNATVTASGKAPDQDINITGNGSFDGKNLSGQRGKVHVGGAASVFINVSDQLDTEMYGMGKVVYYGKPKINQSVVGRGEIVQGN